MSLKNFHANGSVTVEQLLKKLNRIVENAFAAFRQSCANGNITLGLIKLQAADLNRIHGIVVEVDSRRLFYECGDDEIPKFVMQSLYETRGKIRELSKCVWADPACETLIQKIQLDLNAFATKAEKLQPENLSAGCADFNKFADLICEMRIKVWTHVAMLKIKGGSIINPINLPPEIWQVVSSKKQ